MLESDYPPDEGWVFNLEPKWKEYKIDFVVERRNGNKRNRNIIKISYGCSALDRNARLLNGAARKMAGRYVKIEKKILYAREEWELNQTDDSIIVETINGLICKDRALYWADKTT